jgi:hypothetical protein
MVSNKKMTAMRKLAKARVRLAKMKLSATKRLTKMVALLQQHQPAMMRAARYCKTRLKS